MANFDPLFVTVTWGTGGSTASKSLDLAIACEQEHELTTCLHLTCTNMDKAVLDTTLSKAKQNGIRNILALRGDPPRGQEYRTTNADFNYALDLVTYIRREYGDWFCIGVAAYPEGHADITHPDRLDPEDDLPWLAAKVKAGADFILTQLFYDTNAFAKFYKMLLNYDEDCFANIPVIPAIMPIQSYQTLMRMTSLSHASLPKTIHDRVDQVKGDDEAVKRVGVEISTSMIQEIKVKTDGKIMGSHFCTLNLERSVARVLNESGLLKLQQTPLRSISPMKDNGEVVTRILEEAHNIKHSSKTKEDPVAEAAAISDGHGAKGREATWDEFPNGRFGDSRSPAYGELDGWGVSLGVPADQALKMWGSPTTKEDIAQIFIDHIEGRILGTPWSSGPLSSETEEIKDRLIKLNRQQLFTVGSQPVVNCCPSNHSSFGWGPPDGFIFQKSFVEFFASEAQLSALKLKIKDNDQISYYAGTRRGRYESNMGSAMSNAVTWGIFPGKEIAQPTIIEEVSFKAWRDEAFALWTEWERLYEPGSSTARLLRQLQERSWLVSVVHHDFKDADALWHLFDDA